MTVSRLTMIGAALLAAGCTPGDAVRTEAAGLTPKQSALLDKHLGGKVAGEPVTCLGGASRTYQTIRVSDDILLYRASGNLVYRNNLSGGCRGFARDNDVMVIRSHGTGSCKGDFFDLVDRTSGIRGPTCVFGEWIPYRTPAKKP